MDLIEAIGFFGFEMKRIRADEQSGIGAALDTERGANVMESAAAVVQIVLRFVGFDVLVEPIELDVAARDDDAGVVVVFHVIGAQADVFVMQIDIAVGVRDAAHLTLLFGFERGDGAGTVLAADQRAGLRWE